MPFVNNNGVNIHYQVVGQGPPLVMLHGLFGTVHAFYECGYVDALKASHQLILIDHRGHGQSDKPHTPDQYSFQIFADDVISVVNDLTIRDFHVYGHSFGGWVAYSLDIFYPERILSMVNSDGVPGPMEPEMVSVYMDMFTTEEGLKNVESLSVAIKERFIANDKQAIHSLLDCLTLDISQIIESIDNVIEQINHPCLFLHSSAFEEGSDELRLFNKSASVIQNSKIIEFEELSHLEIFVHSQFALPHIKDFLASFNQA